MNRYLATIPRRSPTAVYFLEATDRALRPRPLARYVATHRLERTDATLYGALLFVVCLSVAGSAFSSLRISVLGMMVHPYLAVVGAVSPLLLISRAGTLPLRLVTVMAAFCGLYFASTIAGGIALGEGLKTGAAIVTILTAAVLVRSQRDFQAGVTGLCVAMAFLAIYGLDTLDESTGSLQAIDMANRNAYSLYALPAVLLGGYLLLNADAEHWYLKTIVAVALCAVVFVMATNVNRSGWIGLALVGAMLFRDRRVQGALLVIMMALIVTILASQFRETKALEERVQRTLDGTAHDDVRLELIENSLEIACENPLLGVSPQGLQAELARRLGWSEGMVQSHNVFAHLAGGSGFLCLGALLYIGRLLWTWPIHVGPGHLVAGQLSARKLLRMMLVLWFVRGMFTHEILYSPGFCLGLGMCVGLCVASRPVQSWVAAPDFRRIDELHGI